MRIIFSVTNDLSYDQRMQRICASLAADGHDILLVGRTLPHSITLTDSPFRQKRLRCFFRKGFLFYGEFNIRLFFFLLFFKRCDAVCSIDLDTLPAGFLASLLRRKKRVFDAHEYFSEVPEVVDRRFVKFFWEMLARWILPHYRFAYTVGPGLAGIFEKKYGIPFAVIRNVARSVQGSEQGFSSLGLRQRVILYQGALNEGRGLEAAIQAMQHLDDVAFVIAGEGDRSAQLRALCAELKLENKVQFLGYVAPNDLKALTAGAWLSLNLLENRGLSYYYSLANKFFDSVQASVPVLTMDFLEYNALNQEFEVAVLLQELSPEIVAQAISNLLNDNVLYEKLRQNCTQARQVWNWENESKKLLQFWAQVEAS
jgi:glycosyltransferase involved in cell wall biosynthesis